ncbi:hypothetical protein LC612_06490 [Nostoc sp. CHAB 5834]|nr:hypothetical protein [Nostoc sp. CHAB 5834]
MLVICTGNRCLCKEVAENRLGFIANDRTLSQNHSVVQILAAIASLLSLLCALCVLCGSILKLET